MSAKITKWMEYLRRLPGGGENVLLLASLAIVVALIWGFIELADEVLEGDTQALDARVVRSMRRADDPNIPIGPYWVQEIGRDATALGGAGWLTFFTGVVAGYLWLDRKYRMTLFLLAATVGGLLISGAMKLLFSRPRPDVVPHLSHVATSSFPSGHSLLSAVVYLTLGALLSAVTPQRRLKIYVLVVAILLSVVVGVSRVYLGVHYPTDVLAGWMVGLVWALLCLLTARWLQRKGDIENSGEAA
jgi:undecaprenyl-diphosphatase